MRQTSDKYHPMTEASPRKLEEFAAEEARAQASREWHEVVRKAELKSFKLGLVIGLVFMFLMLIDR